MREAAANNASIPAILPPYTTSWEHISDEVKRIGLLVRLQLSTQRRGRQPGPLDQFKGLVITENEVAELVEGIDGPGSRKIEARRSEAEELSRALASLSQEIEQRTTASLSQDKYLSLPQLSRIFSLTPFEQRCLLICLAPELDRRFEKLYSYLQDDVTRRKPTVDLVLRLTCLDDAERIAARPAFAPSAPLIKHGLITLSDATEPLLSRPLKLGDRIVDQLLGIGIINSVLEGAASVAVQCSEIDSSLVDPGIRDRLVKFARALLFDEGAGRQNLICCLRGPSGSGRRAIAQSVCRDLSLPLVSADLEKLRELPLPFAQAIQALCREAILQPAALCIENIDCILGDSGQTRALFEAIAEYARLTFLIGVQPIRPRATLESQAFIDQEFIVPTPNHRKAVWMRELEGRHGSASEHDLGSLASNFQFTAGQIRSTVGDAQILARWRASGPAGEPGAAEIDVLDLQRACRNQASAKLSSLAQKIEPRYVWRDIVLPEDQLAQLEEICLQARHRDVVYGEWGFDAKLSLGRGLNVLFSGPAGTGKTMAAEVIARELGLDLYKIDLSQVVSKYIGETEKNLHQVFQEAKNSYAILFFDEADALFGKRSEVKDAHDRYSNIEVGYLLQKMDEYDGIAILATNLRQNMDEAFVRRLQVIVDFPFPNQDYRERIWGVVFPRESPISADVDKRTLARDIRVSGGSIKNIALSAAFFAAADGGVIRMQHLWRAARREYQKLGRIWSGAEPAISQTAAS